jgi:epoxyqueuosine reductase QueG
MELSKDMITAQAKALGIDDIRYAKAGAISSKDGELLSLDSLLSGAECIIVLFARYLPALEPAKGHMALSPYYVASHRAHSGARQLAAFIESAGGRALHTSLISAKEAALRVGGFIGDNGFYYHDIYGSFVCIQTILTDSVHPEEYAMLRSECLHCGVCHSGCTGVGSIKECVRKYTDGLVPGTLRGNVYQLLGCERCQSACPLNTPERSAPHEFSLDELLKGRCMGRLKELAGANMARQRRIISQAALYAANSGAYELAAKLKELSLNADEPVRSHAGWAYNKLTGDSDDNA